MRDQRHLWLALGLIAVMAVVTLTSYFHNRDSKVPEVVVPAALPPLSENSDGAVLEISRIQARKDCLISSWSHMAYQSSSMRDEFARQIKKACGLE